MEEKHIKNKNFKRRLTVTFTTILIVLITAIAAITVYEVKKSVLSLLLEEAKEKAGFAAGEVSGIYMYDKENTTEALQNFVEKTVGDSADKVAYCVVIDENATAVAHSDTEKIGKVYDDDYTLSAVQNGEKKSMKFYADVQKYWTYDVMVPVMVDGQQKGCLDMGIPITGVTAFIKSIVNPVLIFSMIAFFAAIAVTTVLMKRAFKSLDIMGKVVYDMAEGQGEETLTYRGSDELGNLADAIRAMQGRLHENQNYIEELSGVLNQMGRGDFNVNLALSYDGSFQVLKDSIDKISGNLGRTLGEIRLATDAAAGGAVKLSKGAEVLSEGAVTQAEAIEGLTNGMEQIREKAGETAEEAARAETFTRETEQAIKVGNTKMCNLSEAMKDITEKSNEIAKIISAIDSIAFQTNILALNAAVEAARAGEAGKGFAVVADEVRNLAGKSAKAAGDITELITSTITAVERGDNITAETVEALKKVGSSSEKVAELIRNISLSAQDEAGNIVTLSKELAQISDVVRTNTLTAESSASDVDRLIEQMDTVGERIGKFRL